MVSPKAIKKIIPYLTSKYTTDRLSSLSPIPFNAASNINSERPFVLVDYTKKFQTIEGFGGAFTDAAAETFFKLNKTRQDEIITAYFSQGEGIGYTIGRTHINSCDFSSASYAYTDVDGDVELAHFSISHDMNYRIPLIKSALDRTKNGLKIFASPWSPPSWMKTNKSMLHGGKLKKEYFTVWANYMVRFIKEFEKVGIPIWGLTVQNEPSAVQTWESCIYSAEEERDFVRDYLGSALCSAGLSHIKVMIWDHNRDMIYDRARIVFDDPEAAKYVWGTAFHWYNGDHFDNVRLVHDSFPGKSLLFTEGCLLPFDREKISDWEWGEKYAKSMLMDLNNWSVGWCDWNLILDERGGPNHVGNYCFAPIIADTRTNAIYYINSYYYIGHFSRFIRPGARRIACSTNCEDFLCTAVQNTDDKIAMVILNITEKNIVFNICVDDHSAAAVSSARSIMTLTF